MLLLAQHNPAHFRTQALHVEFTPQQLNYQAIGAPLNFAQMAARRQPLNCAAITQPLTLANLGVSVFLTLHLAGQPYALLVRQQRADRGDVVLKLISGFVPLEQLQQPLLCALDEVREECLIHSAQGWLAACFHGQMQGNAYPERLTPQAEKPYQLSLGAPSAAHISQQGRPLIGQPSAYIHQPTSSLQLVYQLHLRLPESATAISLHHADEQLIEGRLLTQFNPAQPDLYLLPLHNGTPEKRLWTLQNGQLQAVNTEHLWLSEYFCPRHGWWVEQSRIRWADWQPSLP